MRRKLVAANWKMNGSKAQADSLVTAFIDKIDTRSIDSVIFPPALYIPQLAEKLAGSGIDYGPQNVHAADKGAYTGELSLGMVKEFGCRYVLVGHSERRELFGESDSVIAAKVEAALAAKVTPVLCVGETLAQRDDGITEQVIGEQLNAVQDRVGIRAFERIVIAYEPVWAIGTGKTATPEQAQQVHAFIRGLLAESDEGVSVKSRVLYGGSVKAANARDLFQQPDIDGGLVGGASLLVEEFTAICQAASEA